MAQAVNYYFAIKEQLDQMEGYEKSLRRETMEKNKNNSISEDSNEDEEEKSSDLRSQGMAFGSQPKEQEGKRDMSKSNEKPISTNKGPASSQMSNRQSIHS